MALSREDTHLLCTDTAGHLFIHETKYDNGY
jgi:hypothetical protein